MNLLVLLLALLAPLLSLQPGAVAHAQNTLVVGISGEHGNLDPCVGGAPRTTEIVSAAYEQPVGYTIEEIDGYRVQAIDDIRGWEPLLAESVEISDDGRVYTFHLRQGVRFYPSGNEMTSGDWLWSWERQLSTPSIGWCGFGNYEASISSLDQIEALDRYTVRITTDRANPRTLPFMRLQMFSILDSAEVRKHATPNDPWATAWLAQNTAGTGPYYVASHDPGSRLVLESNPFYWGEKPAYTRVVIQSIQETATRTALLARGDIGLATSIPARFTQSLRANPNINVLSVPSGNRVYLAFNQNTPPFDNLALRQAIAHAVPYQAIKNNVYLGSARLYDSFVLPEIPGYSGAGFDVSFDLEKARTRLTESGIGAGRRLSLTIDASLPEHEQIALLLQDHLGRIGLTLDIQKMPSAQFESALFGKQLGFFLHEGISWIDDPSTIVGLWMESEAFGNFTQFKSDEVDQLQARWQFEPYGTERDAAYRRIQELYNEQLTAIYLVLADYIVLTRRNVEGFVLYKDAGIRYHHLAPAGR